MYLYKKTIKPQNRTAWIISLLCFLVGAVLFTSAANIFKSGAAIAQLIGILLLTFAIYILSAYLIRQYTFSVEHNKNEDGGIKETYDFIITEQRYGKTVKVCHFKLTDITGILVVDAENKNQVSEERKSKLRYSYNTEFAPKRYIELSASLDGEDYSVIVTYDFDLFQTLNNAINNK